MENTNELLINISMWISGLKRPLESISYNSESRFVKLGQDLQSVYADAERLEKLAVETTGMISGDGDDKLLSNISELAKGALVRIESSRADVSELFPRFKSCQDQMKRLKERCPGIVKIAKTLNMVALNISTESSRTEECVEMFGIFVKEIRELAKKVGEISRRIKEDSEDSSVVQEHDFSGILDRGNELNKTAEKAREMVSENIRGIDNVMNLSLQSFQRSEAHSQRISGLVGDVVVAIQFHDIVRQQIEHVMEAFQDVEYTVNEKGNVISGGNGEDASILLGKAHGILRLQALQLEQIISEIRDAHRKITVAFEEIGSEIETLVSDVSQMSSVRDEGDRQDSALALLLAGFGRLEKIIENSDELIGEIDDVMKHTKASASNLSDYLSLIEEVSMELHIKSINALIMSKSLGRNGITLSVLAQYVTEVSKGSDEFVREVIEIIKAIDASAHDLNIASLKSDEGTDYKHGTRASLKDGINRISGSYERFLKNVDLSHDQSMRLKKKISDVGSGLAFMTEMKDNLDGCLKDIKIFVEKLRPFSFKDQKTIEDLSRVQSRYTMESERGIHRRSIGSDDRTQGETIKETQDSDTELGDNVELF